jgi:hypothetical protein
VRETAAHNWIVKRTEKLNRELLDQFTDWKVRAIESLATARQAVQEFPETTTEYFESRMRPAMEEAFNRLDRNLQSETPQAPRTKNN